MSFVAGSIVDRTPPPLAGIYLVAATVFLIPARTPARSGPAVERRETRLYREARVAVEQSPERAHRLARALDSFPVADDRRLDLLFETSLRTGRLTSAGKMLARYRGAAPSGADRRLAGLRRIELDLLRGELTRAGERLNALESNPTGEEVGADDGRYLTARRLRLRHDLALARDNRDRARRAARRLTVRYPDTEAARRPGLLEVSPLSADERLTRARALYRAWDYRRARREFERLVASDEHTDRAHWFLGHIALNQLRERPDRAADHFGRLTEDSRYDARALYQLARTHMNREAYRRARRLLDRYHRRHPQGRHTEDVFYYRGWLPYDHGRNRAAIEGFRAYLDRYGRDGPRSSYIYGFLAWTHMRLEQWREAIDVYEEMEPFGNTLVWGKALYWQARAHVELEEPETALAHLDELREAYPLTYYGMLGEQLRARIRGGDPAASARWWPEHGGGADSTPRLDAESWQPEDVSSATRSDWNRARALVSLGERERARDIVEPVWDRLLASVPAPRRDAWVHAAGQFLGNYHRMWDRSTGGSISAMPGLPDPDSLDAVMAYPRAYPGVVRQVADEFDVPSHLIWSIMRQESRYRPSQVSHADAIGALQMIPETARKVARDLGVEYDRRTFHRPSVGFRYSGFYLRKLIRLFDGMFVPAAAAYNSGPDVVARWFRENPDAGFPWLIEEFAYNEGRNYCRKVAEHMLRYLYLYEDDPDRRDRLLDALFPLDRAVALPERVGY